MVKVDLFFLIFVGTVCTKTLGWRMARFRSFAHRQKVKLRTQIVTLAVVDLNKLTYASMDTDEKRKAFETLDWITCPSDENHPMYDADKNMKRKKLLATHQFEALKYELLDKGLETDGDKLEMLTRLMLHKIDPSIHYQQLTGLEPQVSYITEEDYASGRVRKLTEEEKAVIRKDPLGHSDCDDLRVLRASAGSSGQNRPRKLLLDGLKRKEVSFPTVRIQRSQRQAMREDRIRRAVPQPLSSRRNVIDDAEDEIDTKDRKIGAYVVAHRSNIQAWNTASAVILLPTGADYWRDKDIRKIADEVSFGTGSMVIVPDVFLSHTYQTNDTSSSRAIDDLENALGLFRGITFGTREEWLKHQDSKRVFDDIVATVMFLRAQYKMKRFSFMGAGEGGGYALEAACVLGDLARLNMYTTIEKHLLRKGIIPALQEGSEEIPFDAVDAAIVAGLESQTGPAFQILQEVVKDNIMTFPHYPLNLLVERQLKAEYKAMRAAHNAQHELAELTRVTEIDLNGEGERGEEADDLLDDNYDDDADISKNHLTSAETAFGTVEMDGEAKARDRVEPPVFTKLGELNPSADDEADEETVARKDAPDRVSLASLLENKPSEEEVNAALSNTDIAALIEMSRRRAAAKRTEAKDETASGDDYQGDLRFRRWIDRAPTQAEIEKMNALSAADQKRVENEQRMKLYRAEWPQILRSAKRAESRHMLDPYATVSMSELPTFVPRLVVAFSPTGYDVAKVGKELSIPPLIIYGTGRPDLNAFPTGSSTVSNEHEDKVALGYPEAAAEISTLRDALVEREGEVLDYGFRIYKGARPDFVHKNRFDFDARCSERALIDAGGWISSYAHLKEDSAILGLGEHKQSASMYLVYNPENMRRPASESCLATYLHDDPIYFRNNQLDV